MIKAVIFDFFGVLCSEEYWHSLKKDPNLADKFDPMAKALHLGSLSWPEFVQRLARETGKSIEEIQSAYESERINLPLVTYIAELHKKYKTGLLSNAAYEAFEPRGQEIGFDKLFDYALVSSQVGIAKPNPEIYKIILDKLEIQADEAVYIDDSSRMVEGAVKLGMAGIHYQAFGQMKSELDKILASGSDN